MTMESRLTFNDEIRYTLIQLIAEGYTARYITQFMREHGVELSDAQVLQAAVQFEGDVAKYQEELGQDAIERGYARKEVRLRHLNRIAERLEPEEDGKPLNLKQTKAYCDVLDQIAREADPLGLRIPVNKGDQWLAILMMLRETALQAPNQQESTKSVESSESSLPTSSEKSSTAA